MARIPRNDEIIPQAGDVSLEALVPAEAVPPPAVFPVTIQDVIALMADYLVGIYVESPIDEEAVYEAERLMADGHVGLAFRQLVRMVEGILNLPPL